MDPTLSELRQRADKLKPKVTFEDLNLALGTIKQSIYQAIDEAGVPYRGMFSIDESYRRGDIVNYRNGLWICLASSQGQAPEFSDNWQLMIEAGGSGRVGSRITVDDLVAYIANVSSTHTFQTTETAVNIAAVPDEANNIELVDTAWGPDTGLRFTRGALALNAFINCNMAETGPGTDCLIAFKAAPYADRDDTGAFVDTDFYSFTSSDSNQGSITFSPNATSISQDIVFTLTTQKTSATPEITFAPRNLFGRTIPSLAIEITGLRLV